MLINICSGNFLTVSTFSEPQMKSPCNASKELFFFSSSLFMVFFLFFSFFFSKTYNQIKLNMWHRGYVQNNKTNIVEHTWFLLWSFFAGCLVEVFVELIFKRCVEIIVLFTTPHLACDSQVLKGGFYNNAIIWIPPQKTFSIWGTFKKAKEPFVKPGL